MILPKPGLPGVSVALVDGSGPGFCAGFVAGTIGADSPGAANLAFNICWRPERSTTISTMSPGLWPPMI